MSGFKRTNAIAWAEFLEKQTSGYNVFSYIMIDHIVAKLQLDELPNIVHLTDAPVISYNKINFKSIIYKVV